jgi:plastocyanin
MNERRALATLLLLAAAGSLLVVARAAPVNGPPPGRSATIVSVVIQSMTYTPREAAVGRGDIVVWTNSDIYQHTVTADAHNAVLGGPNSDAKYPDGFTAGQTYAWTVPADAVPGTTWYYHCRFHGQPGDGKRLGDDMSGSITVR